MHIAQIKKKETSSGKRNKLLQKRGHFIVFFRKPHFLQMETQRKTIFKKMFFRTFSSGINLIVPKRAFKLAKRFIQAENIYESEGVHFDRTKIFRPKSRVMDDHG